MLGSDVLVGQRREDGGDGRGEDEREDAHVEVEDEGKGFEHFNLLLRRFDTFNIGELAMDVNTNLAEQCEVIVSQLKAGNVRKAAPRVASIRGQATRVKTAFVQDGSRRGFLARVAGIRG